VKALTCYLPLATSGRFSHTTLMIFQLPFHFTSCRKSTHSEASICTMATLPLRAKRGVIVAFHRIGISDALLGCSQSVFERPRDIRPAAAVRVDL
jgi:hypothetical protein